MHVVRRKNIWIFKIINYLYILFQIQLIIFIINFENSRNFTNLKISAKCDYKK